MLESYVEKIYEYPDGSKRVTQYKNPVLRGSGSVEISSNGRSDKIPAEKKEENDRQYLFKVKRRIKDYVRSNDFKYFVTLTFGKNRKDDEEKFKQLDNWLRYMKKKHGLFDYILVPERHETGEIHLHGVFGECGMEMVDSGVKHKNRTIYNMPEWRYGFTTISVIEHRGKTANYLVDSYMTKDNMDVVPKGKKKYWSSNGLRKPVVSYSAEYTNYNVLPNWMNDDGDISIIEVPPSITSS